MTASSFPNVDHIKTDHQILARTLYGEARGEFLSVGSRALIAVGNVILNRRAHHTWYGSTLREICQKPWQFSCWNPKDPNRHIVEDPTLDTPIFRTCLLISHRFLTDPYEDVTQGSTHYYSAHLPSPPPWSRGLKPCCRIGRHIFFNLNGR